MKINFYNVDKQYIEFLKNFEIQHRGFTCVPNIQYTNNDKFNFRKTKLQWMSFQ